MEETAALIASNEIKKRLAGITSLHEQLLQQNEQNQQNTVTSENLVYMLPDLMLCLKDHNFKIAITTLEILELAIPRVPESVLRGHFKNLWSNVVERLGDSKIQVREKAVDVVVELTSALGISIVFEKLKPCFHHKNWRTREQILHCVWRTLERFNLFNALKDEVLDDVLRLLEDSTKDVRDAAILTLEKFYAHIGSSLMNLLNSKNIRGAHMRTLMERFGCVSEDVYSYSTSAASQDSSSPTLQSQYAAGSSSSRRGLTRQLSAPVSTTKSYGSSASSYGSSSVSPPGDNTSIFKSQQSTCSMTDRDVQRELGEITDGLRNGNDWTKRVDALKTLQQLGFKVKGNQSACLALSQGLRSTRDLLCEQVADLRSSVAREACVAIQTLADSLGEDFNLHAESCINVLLKSTYVTIQIVSTSADTCIRKVIESSRNGYARVIAKFIEGAKTKNQVLRQSCVIYLARIVEVWSKSHLSKHMDLFTSILPVVLQDALAEVRSAARKLYWAFHSVFESEANYIFDRLDGTTQKNLLEDPSRFTAASKILSNGSNLPYENEPTLSSSSSSLGFDRKASSSLRMPRSKIQKTQSSISAEDEVNYSKSHQVQAASTTSGPGPRRVLDSNSNSSNTSTGGALGSSFGRFLSQGALRVEVNGGDGSKSKGLGADGSTKSFHQGPLRVLNIAGKGGDSSNNSNPHVRPQRVLYSTDSKSLDAPEAPTGSNSSSTIGGSAKEASFVAPFFTSRALDDALYKAENSLWSTRLEAIETIGAFLKHELETSGTGCGSNQDDNDMELDRKQSTKVDERILHCLMNHLADAHHRVVQASLKHFEMVLKKASSQLTSASLKNFLPKLLFKSMDSKEQIRVLAKDLLEYLLKDHQHFNRRDLICTSAIAFGDGGAIDHSSGSNSSGNNIKMRVGIGKYLQELFKDASAISVDFEATMTSSQINGLVRLVLSKIAQVMDTNGTSSSSKLLYGICENLLVQLNQMFPKEMEFHIPSLSSSKRTLVMRCLRTKVGMDFSSSGSIKLPSKSNVTTTTSTAVEAKDISMQNIEEACPEEEMEDDNDEDVDMKEANTIDDDYFMKATRLTSREMSYLNQFKRFHSREVKQIQDHYEEEQLFERLIEQIGQQNNAPSSEMERAHLFKEFNTLLSNGSSTRWNENFGRVLHALLDAAVHEKEIEAMNALHRLVERFPKLAEQSFYPIFMRLMNCFGGSTGNKMEEGMLGHRAENILKLMVKNIQHPLTVWNVLIPIIETSDQSPVLLKISLQLLEMSLQLVVNTQLSDKRHELGEILLSTLWSDRFWNCLREKLCHPSSDVRKSAVSSLVAYYFASGEAPLFFQYLNQLEPTKRKLVQMFIKNGKNKNRINPYQ